MFLPIFFGGCGISAMWKLASSHWRVLLRRSGDPQFFGNEAKYDFFHNDCWKVFFPHCILNHTGRTVLWKPGTLVDLECEMLGGGFKYFLFSSLFGQMIQFDFSNGLKPPPRKWLGGFKKYQPKIKDPPDVFFFALASFEAGCFRRIDGLGATHAGARGFWFGDFKLRKAKGMNPETW